MTRITSQTMMVNVVSESGCGVRIVPVLEVDIQFYIGSIPAIVSAIKPRERYVTDTGIPAEKNHPLSGKGMFLLFLCFDSKKRELYICFPRQFPALEMNMHYSEYHDTWYMSGSTSIFTFIHH